MKSRHGVYFARHGGIARRRRKRTVSKSMAFYPMPRGANSSPRGSRRDSHPETERLPPRMGGRRLGKNGGLLEKPVWLRIDGVKWLKGEEDP